MVLEIHRVTLFDFQYLYPGTELPHTPSFSLMSLCLSNSLFLSVQSIQLYVVEMLEAPGEPSSALAIQTVTLHLSTAPGLLKSATGKARNTHTHTHYLGRGKRCQHRGTNIYATRDILQQKLRKFFFFSVCKFQQSQAMCTLTLIII